MTMTRNEALATILAGLPALFMRGGVPQSAPASPPGPGRPTSAGWRDPLANTPPDGQVYERRTVYVPPDYVGRVTAPVVLKKPLNRQLVFDLATRDGSARAGQEYEAYEERGAAILPGAQVKLIELNILRPLGDKTFTLVVGWPYNHPPPAGHHVMIKGGKDLNPHPAPAPVAFPPAKARAGRRLAWSSDFREPVVPTAEPGKWRSRFPWHRWQESNGELGPNADPLTDDGVETHPIRNGLRVLRAHRAKVLEKGRPFDYAAALMQSSDLFTGRYGYIELEAKIDRRQGTIPAFWMLQDERTLNGAPNWPPEVDIFEVGLGDDPRLASTIHYVRPDGVKAHEGTRFARTVDDGVFHRYGLDWTPEWLITLLDGKEIHRRPNIFHVPMYLIVNVAVGGLAPAPRNVDAGWESTMTLKRVEWWR
jgi:hypothetical protein